VEVVEVADVALGGGGGEREARGEGDDAESHCGEMRRGSGLALVEVRYLARNVFDRCTVFLDEMT
jgi:hypothetical protein